MKKAKEKAFKFTVGAYLNPAYKKAAETTMGRAADIIESSNIRDEVSKCIDFTYSLDGHYINGDDNNIKPQSHFVAMLCLYNSLTKTTFPNDGLMEEVTLLALGILGYEYENNIVKLDYPNIKDNEIYSKCIEYINNRKKSSAEEEIEEFILSGGV